MRANLNGILSPFFVAKVPDYELIWVSFDGRVNRLLSPLVSRHIRASPWLVEVSLPPIVPLSKKRVGFQALTAVEIESVSRFQLVAV